MSFAFPDVDGVVRGVVGAEDARAVPDVSEVQVMVGDGDPVGRLVSCHDRHAWVRAEHPDPERGPLVACFVA
jgi:hypothetical protein